MNRRECVRRMGGGLFLAGPLSPLLAGIAGCRGQRAAGDEPLFVSRAFTAPGTFTSGVEGPAVDAAGNLYAVNFERQGTIGRVTPAGVASVFVELPAGSIGNGIRFDSRGDMLIADYTNHNILRVDMETRAIRVHAHNPDMSQPNDIAIGANDLVYASDPAWSAGTGRLWRVDTDGSTTLLEGDMGTTNGVEVGPDERTLYVNESRARSVWAYDLSPLGEIGNKRLLIRFEEDGLDGMRCDVDGNLYIARYGRGTVAIVSPGGELVREVPLANGTNVTNVAFGGRDGRTVYATVADVGNVQLFRADRPGRSWALRR